MVQIISKTILLNDDAFSRKRVMRMWVPLERVYANEQKAIYGMMSSVASALAGSGSLNIKRIATSVKIIRVRNSKANPVINNRPLSANDRTWLSLSMDRFIMAPPHNMIQRDFGHAVHQLAWRRCFEQCSRHASQNTDDTYYFFTPHCRNHLCPNCAVISW
jgi:hypothetical protein